jgi:hypothetical protein
MANGAAATAAAGLELPATLGDPNVIKLFEDGLAMAKAGRIVGVGFVVATEHGKPLVSIGGQFALSLYYGCDKLKYQLSQAIDAPSKILRPGG